MDNYNGIERILAERRAKRMQFARGGDVRAGDSVGGLRGDTGAYSGKRSDTGYSGPVSRSGMGATQRNVQAAQNAQAVGSGRGAVESSGERAAAQAAQQAAQREATKAAQQAAVETAIRKQNQANYRVTPSSVYTRGSAAKGLAQAEAEEKYYRETAQRIMGVEVGGQKDIFNAKNPKSSATGPAQYTNRTWLKTLERYRPDILRAYNRKTVLDMRSTQPQLVEEVLTRDVEDYSKILSSKGIAATQGNVYLMHFLGAGDALKVLRGDPDQSVATLVQPEAVDNNRSILEDRSVVGLQSWANKKMANAQPINLMEVASAEAPKGSDVSNVPIPVPRPRLREYTLDTAPPNLKLMLAGGSDQATIDAVKRADLSAPGAKFASANAGAGFAVPKENSEGKTSGTLDWSKGNLPFIDNTDYKKQIYEKENPFFPGENVVNTVSGDTAESYALKFANGDLSKVQSRITNMNGFPQVEFFIRGLDEVIGDIVTGPFKTVGSALTELFGGNKPEKGPNKGYDPNAVTATVGYGPYGNLTADQYRQQYGGGKGAPAELLLATAPVTGQPAVVAPAAPVQQTAVVQPFDYTGTVQTVQSPYGLKYSSYKAPVNNLSSIDEALSLLRKRNQLYG